MTVQIDIGEGRTSNLIEVRFGYNRLKQDKMKSVPGARWLRGKRCWAAPLDVETCRELRKKFGDELVIGKPLKKWAKEAMAKERNLGSLSTSHTAELVRLPEVFPDLYATIHVGPRGRFLSEEEFLMALEGEPPSFQAADVAFMAQSTSPCNFNEPGTGKTLETIASVYEAGIEAGLHLVVCPVSSMETVWKKELLTHTDAYVLVARGSKAARQRVIEEAVQLSIDEPDESVWLIVNPAMLAPDKMPNAKKDEEGKYEKVKDDYTRKAKPKEEDFACQCPRMKDGHWHYRWKYPTLYEHGVRCKIVDEAHDAAIGNMKSLTAIGLKGLPCEKPVLLTATPFGGKIVKLFGLLNFADPTAFPSVWQWANKWLIEREDEEDSGYGKNLNKMQLDPEKEEAFYKSLAPYVLRRTKAEVLPWLPPKQYVDIWAEMSGGQKEQYEKFEADSEISLGGAYMSATSVLAEYTRLRQFSGAKFEYVDGEFVPTTESCKLPHIMQILSERGIGGKDQSGDEQVVIFSQFSQMVDMVTEYLRGQGVAVDKITGQISREERARLQDEFQAEGGLRVLVMSTKAGGVSITLDRASTVIILDETWNPDNQEQAEDRCHRASRIHQVTIYYIRTKDSIEEYVLDTTTGKSMTNEQVLDIQKRMAEKPHMSEAA